MESSEISLKLKSDVGIFDFKLACGNLSQNFIDELYSATSYEKSSSGGFEKNKNKNWVDEYRNLMESPTSTSNPFLLNAHHHFTNISPSASQNSDEEEGENSVPGLGPETISSSSGRESLLKSILDSKKDAYTDLRNYELFIGSWNVNGQSPGSVCLKEWLGRSKSPPHLYAVGFQELDLSKEAFVFTDSPKEKEWDNSVKGGLHGGAKYKKLELVRLVGMMLIVYVREDLVKSVHSVVGEYVGTGILGKMGNKGGVAVRFEIEETSICIVNCHLAAHVEEYQRRNQDFSQLSSRMIFHTSSGPKHIRDHDQIYWFGDMNYRINPSLLDAERAKVLIKNEKYGEVLKYDQLKDQMRENRVFQGYNEGAINFRPTYKYDIHSDNWDSSEKNRSPAWCDRILWKGENMKQIDYSSTPSYKLSDHKPVSSLFESKVKVVNQVRYRKVYEDALKWLDKEENKCLPQVSVEIPGSGSLPHSNRNEIHFGIVRFLEPIRRSFTIRNVGQFVVRFEFIKKLNDHHICKDWLTIEPTSAFIQPESSIEILVEVLVEKRSAGGLNSGRDNLYDILVVHLEGGKDIFITVVGEYERSVFGTPIQTLVNMALPMRQVSPGQLLELEKGGMPMSKYDIPKEIWFLVDRIYKTGMDKESVFSQSGITSEILLIRDWLNEIPNTPLPGSVESVAETLLTLLDSFPEPVIPYSLHLKCMDASSNYSHSKSIIKQLPPSHRNVFIYIVTFLRELLAHSSKNGLDPKILAMLFGRVLLHTNSKNDGRGRERDEMRKEGFLYQFLVNDESFTEDL